MTVKAEFFYTDSGTVSSTDRGWLQLAFNMLTGLFGRVRIWINICKNVGIVCRPCLAAGVRSDKAYTQSMTG